MRDTIKKHTDFIAADTDVTARAAGFIIRARPTRFADGGRYGLVTTKRTFRHAVDRNRARRRLRAWIGACEKMLKPGWDYIFIARPSILNWSHTDAMVAMGKALHYLSHQKKSV